MRAVYQIRQDTPNGFAGSLRTTWVAEQVLESFQLAMVIRTRSAPSRNINQALIADAIDPEKHGTNRGEPSCDRQRTHPVARTPLLTQKRATRKKVAPIFFPAPALNRLLTQNLAMRGSSNPRTFLPKVWEVQGEYLGNPGECFGRRFLVRKSGCRGECLWASLPVEVSRLARPCSPTYILT